MPRAARAPSSVNVGGMRTSRTTRSGRARRTAGSRSRRRRGRPRRGDRGRRTAAPGRRAAAPGPRRSGRARQLRDHVVPRPGSLASRSRPPSAATRSDSPRSPGPFDGLGTADAVVADRHHRCPSRRATCTDDTRCAAGVLHGIRQRLAGDEVRGRLDVVGEAFAAELTSMGTGVRSASAASAAPRPWSRAAGRTPLASSLRSTMASLDLVDGVLDGGAGRARRPSPRWTCRRASPMPSSRCWAPSCRSRSSRRRSAYPAATMRARDACTSASWCRTSACNRAISIARPARSRTSRSAGSGARPRSPGSPGGEVRDDGERGAGPVDVDVGAAVRRVEHHLVGRGRRGDHRCSRVRRSRARGRAAPRRRAATGPARAAPSVLPGGPRGTRPRAPAPPGAPCGTAGPPRPARDASAGGRQRRRRPSHRR